MAGEPSLGGEMHSENRSVREGSISSTKSSARKRRAHRIRKAKEWTYYIEIFKSTVDCLYEICRMEQSISGCKETLLYVQNAERDFQSLIDVILLEQSYKKEEPHAVSWAIRKSVTSPTRLIHEKGAQMLMDVLPMSPIVMNDVSLSYAAVVDRSSRKDTIDKDEASWQVVKRRRRSNTSTISDILESDLDVNSKCEPAAERPRSVYERLSSNVPGKKMRSGVNTPRSSSSMIQPNRGSNLASKLNCPKSAMDLPQTKASMAKMSFCRQRIWETSVKPSLAKKFQDNKKKERERSVTTNTKEVNRRRNKAATPKRVSSIAEPEVPHLKPASARSLQSISETVEQEDTAAVSADGALCREETSNSNRSDRVSPTLLAGPEIENDREWRELTEEEESLAMEAMSIKLEIEKAESEIESIDSELFMAGNEKTKNRQICEKSSPEVENVPLSYSEAVKKMQEEFKNMCHESWSDMVEKEFAGRYREPGVLADRHEMLSSPLKRCDKDDASFSDRYAERLRKADETRERLLAEKKNKLSELDQKRQLLLKKQAELKERKRKHLENRMVKASENRQKSLAEIKRKAKEDEIKVNEVKYINSMADCHRKIDLRNKDAKLKKRKLSLEKERAKKVEEQAAREHAADQRRKLADKNVFTHRDRSSVSVALCGTLSVSPLSDPLRCCKCDVVLPTEFDSAAHVLSGLHMKGVQIGFTSLDDFLFDELIRLDVATDSRDNNTLCSPDELNFILRKVNAEKALRVVEDYSQFVDCKTDGTKDCDLPKRLLLLATRLSKCDLSRPLSKSMFNKLELSFSEAAEYISSQIKPTLEELGTYLCSLVDKLLEALYCWTPQFPSSCLAKMIMFMTRALSSKVFCITVFFRCKTVDILKRVMLLREGDDSQYNLLVVNFMTVMMKNIRLHSTNNKPLYLKVEDRLKLMSLTACNIGSSLMGLLETSCETPLRFLMSLKLLLDGLSTGTGYSSEFCPLRSYIDALLTVLLSKRWRGNSSVDIFWKDKVSELFFIIIACCECCDEVTLKQEFFSHPSRSIRMFLLLKDYVHYLAIAGHSSLNYIGTNRLISTIHLLCTFCTMGGVQRMMCCSGHADSVVCRLSGLPLRLLAFEETGTPILTCLILILRNSPLACDLLVDRFSHEWFIKFLETVSVERTKCKESIEKYIPQQDIQIALNFFNSLS